MSESLSNFSQASALATSEERPHHIYEPERYAETRFVAFPKNFVALRNPLARIQQALVHLGPAPGSSPPSYSPNFNDPDEEPTDRQRRLALAKQQSEACKIIFAPGETKLIPRELVRALVTVRNNVVIGGLCPFLVLAEGDPNPPSYAPCFELEAEEPFSVPGAKS